MFSAIFPTFNFFSLSYLTSLLVRREIRQKFTYLQYFKLPQSCCQLDWISAWRQGSRCGQIKGRMLWEGLELVGCSAAPRRLLEESCYGLCETWSILQGTYCRLERAFAVSSWQLLWMQARDCCTQELLLTFDKLPMLILVVSLNFPRVYYRFASFAMAYDNHCLSQSLLLSMVH